MSVGVVYAFNATATEVLPGNTSSAADSQRTVVHSQFDRSGTLNGGTTPALTLMAEFILTLSGGVATIDLTGLTGTNGAAVSLSGKTVVLMSIENLGANKMTFAKGASNGHDFFTTDGMDVRPPSGGFPGMIQVLAPSGTAVDGSNKTWDVTGTLAQTAKIRIFGG